MILNNTTQAPIKDISFEGYWFTLPVGVFACWDKFGEFLTSSIYKIDGDGGGVPPVIPATPAQWGGVKYADVRRFELNGELIPSKKDLLKLAKQRGVDAEQIEAWTEDESIENKDIAQVINELAVPDAIKYPAVAEVAAPKASTIDEADAIVNAPGAQTTTTPPPAAPKAPTVAGAPAKKGAKGKTVAKKVPVTPKKPVAPKTPAAPKE